MKDEASTLKRFCKVQGIDGPSLDKTYSKTIELIDLQFNSRGSKHAPGSSQTDRVGAVTVEPIRIMKPLDTTSAQFLRKLLKGELIETITITSARHGGTKVQELTLGKAFISGRTVAGDVESIDITPTTVKVESFSDAGASTGAVTYNLLTREVA